MFSQTIVRHDVLRLAIFLNISIFASIKSNPARKMTDEGLILLLLILLMMIARKATGQLNLEVKQKISDGG